MPSIAIIGGGPAGYVAAITAARQGNKVTVIDQGPLGGTCLNEAVCQLSLYCKVLTPMSS